jgi:dethiobiotin synthetase
VRSVFVTGTDTGVGKTVLTAAICATSGASAMKPVQTGALHAEDLDFVTAVTGRALPLDVACPYRFAEPLAPAVAAARAGETIDLDRIEACYRTLAAAGPVVVEGAGGILVEVTPGVTMAGLAARLRLPVVIACRPGLGTLNHTALTVEAARRRDLDVIGLVVVGWPAEPDLATRTNPRELARMAPIAGVIPFLEHPTPTSVARVAKASLAAELSGTFDAEPWLAGLASGPKP